MLQSANFYYCANSNFSLWSPHSWHVWNAISLLLLLHRHIEINLCCMLSDDQFDLAADTVTRDRILLVCVPYTFALRAQLLSLNFIACRSTYHSNFNRSTVLLRLQQYRREKKKLINRNQMGLKYINMVLMAFALVVLVCVCGAQHNHDSFVFNDCFAL